MASTGPTVWVVHDGKIGMANQVIGLAEAVGFPFAEKRLDIRAPWRHLAPQLWLRPLAALGPAGGPPPPPRAAPLPPCRRAAAPPGPPPQRAPRRRGLLGAGQGPRFAPPGGALCGVARHHPARRAN